MIKTSFGLLYAAMRGDLKFPLHVCVCSALASEHTHKCNVLGGGGVFYVTMAWNNANINTIIAFLFAYIIALV